MTKETDIGGGLVGGWYEARVLTCAAFYCEDKLGKRENSRAELMTGNKVSGGVPYRVVTIDFSFLSMKNKCFSFFLSFLYQSFLMPLLHIHL